MKSFNTHKNSRVGINLLFYALFAVILFISGTVPALGATFTVNYEYARSDSNPGDCICDNGEGLCSVNTAVQEANACPGADDISVPTGTHFVSTISISDSVVIYGTGSSATILNADGTYDFTVAESVSASLLGLQLTGDWRSIVNNGTLSLNNAMVTGITPSGIFINYSPITNRPTGTLIISNSVIDGNTSNAAPPNVRGGAIDNSGSLTITSSTFSNNSSPLGCGGAILNGGLNAEVMITGSHFTGNSASSGGAICNGVIDNLHYVQAITIERSSLTNNSATADGGSIYQAGDGTNLILLVNTTVSGNEANLYGGGAYISSGVLESASSTIAYNVANADRSAAETGGGIYNAETGTGTVNLKNTILAKNTRLSGPILTLVSDCVGPQVSGGYNLVGYNCGIYAAIGDQFGSFSVLDPALNPVLQTLGVTKYHPLLSSSPAIDSGDFGGCLDNEGTLLLVDQIGNDRVRGFVCDIGAAESAYTAGRMITYPVDDLATTEAGGSAVVNIRINGHPSSNIALNATSSDTSEGSLSASSVLFTPGGTLTQSLTVTGVDDDIDDGDIAYSINFGTTASTDDRFRDIDPDDRSATNADDGDTAGITIGDRHYLDVTEAGGTETFTVVLDSEPISNVTIPLASSDTTEVTVSPGSLTFTAANWDQAQTVTATGVDDYVDDGGQSFQIAINASTSSDPNYNGLDPVDFDGSNADDDEAGMTPDPWDRQFSTSESGGQDSFTVVLESEPTATVTVPVASDNTSEVTVSPTSLTFTSGNWSTPQTVTLTGVDDDVKDWDVFVQISLGPTSSVDSLYQGITTSNDARNVDNDTAGFTVTPSGGLVTTEAGGQDTYTIVLTSEPLSSVTIPGIFSGDTGEATVAPSSMVFTAQNWNTPQTVTVTGVDDSIVDGHIQTFIWHSQVQSSDPLYANKYISNVTLTNEDDDEGPFIIVSPYAGLVTSEDGGTDTFTIVLAAAPTATVSIPLESSDTSEGTISPALVSFTTTNWDVPQEVVITGVDDPWLDYSVNYRIWPDRAQSDDVDYDGLNVQSVYVVNMDDGEPYSSPGPGCDTTPVDIVAATYWDGEIILCIDTESITAGTDVTVGDGADVTYQAPVILLLPGFTVQQGGVFRAGNE